jgi:hypothetical protein
VNAILWGLQILLAIVFVGPAIVHITRRDRPRKGQEWMLDVPKPLLTTIGMVELLGVVGLILPAATHILPILTPIAASCFGLLMLFAAIFHLRRHGEVQNAVFNIILGVLAAFVAYGRFVLEPIS